MSNLQAFLAQNVKKPKIVKRAVSDRFEEPVLDENKNPVIDEKTGEPLMQPIKWHFGAIGADLDEELRKQNTKRLPVPGKKNIYMPEIDFEEYQLDIAVATIKFPDLYNAELQDSYGVKSAKALLSKMLMPGEMANVKKIVQEVNGYDIDMNELVEDAKN